jgi:ABC-type multidrug transport system fused ATPase/permease subunit
MTANAVSENVSMGVRRVFDATGALGLMLWLSPSLSLVSVSIVPIFFVSSFFGRWAKRQTQLQLARLSESTAIAEERLHGIR